MTLLIGYIIVLASVVGGLYLGGGSPLVLLHLSEFVVVGGVCVGILIIASPSHVLRAIAGKILSAIRGGGVSRNDYLDMLKLLYQIFMTARRDGIIAIEDHIMNPSQSAIIAQYPKFAQSGTRLEFFCNAFRPIIDGKVKPEQIRGVLDVEIRVIEKESSEPVHVLELVGDSFPGVGICAAVLGIILTMGSIAQGPETVGYKVAAALTGTFLGVYGAYGFINPLAALIDRNNRVEVKYYECMATAVTAFANGFAPIMAIEMARRSLESHVRPGAEELEEMLKPLGRPVKS